MDDLKELFLRLEDEEFAELIQNTEIPVDTELSEKIRERLEPDLSVSGVRPFRLIKLIPVAAAICIVIAGTLIFSLSRPESPAVTTQPPSETSPTTVQSPAENPLMVAISSGNDDLVTNLLTLPGLLSQDTLEFALGFSDLLSYETLNRIAESVKELLGSTGLDALVEGAILGDSEKVLAEIRRRDSMLMTPFEKLAFLFAVAFCDSEAVDAFVSRGYDIHTTDLQGNSIYAIAKKYGNEDTMQYAVSKGITE